MSNDAEVQNTILALIDTAVEEKTFSLDALTAIQKIKEEVSHLDRSLRTTRGSFESQKSATEHEHHMRLKAEGQVEKWVLREKELTTREAKVTELEKDTAVAKAVSSTYFTVFDKMFANRQFRETVMENGTKPMMMPSGGGYAQSASETRTVTTEKSDIK